MISMETYQKRRQNLGNRLPEGHCIVLQGSGKKNRNGDVDYPFRQCSSFWYCVPFTDPDARCVIYRQGDVVRTLLFCPPQSEVHALWEGRRCTPERAVVECGVDEAYPLTSFTTWMQKKSFDTWWVCEKDQVDLQGAHQGAWQFVDAWLATDRLIKSSDEINCLREAIRISVAGHQALYEQRRSLQSEQEAAALLHYTFAKEGAAACAYPSIVAGGSRACTLHYIQNDQPLSQGEHLLVDAGAEWQGYAADITRTYALHTPAVGEFKALFDLVLATQHAVIAHIKPGVTWQVIETLARTHLTQGLHDLGLLKGTVEESLTSEAYRKFYPHSVGHWLGLDVHDVGGKQDESGQWRPFEAGMVLTVEPGLYCQDVPTALAGFSGLGVRIEDNILVTDTGCEVLTQALATHDGT